MLTIYRLIAPQWADLSPKVLEGTFSPLDIKKYNQQGYNIYYLPNYPSDYTKGVTVDGSMIDTFNYVFVDCDLKDNKYTDKDDFLTYVGDVGITPSKVVDSGNGIHVYWKISDLDAMSFLRFQRRLLRLFDTDDAVATLYQLMRVEGTINTKKQDNLVPCELLLETDTVYTCEELDRLLPPITLDDETYCQQHYDKTHNINQNTVAIDDTLPPKFGKFIRDNEEAKALFAGNTDDRSKSDFRLGHLLYSNGFSKDEALSVLVNSAKALQRAPKHRASYADNIVSKIWTFEQTQDASDLSSSVADILTGADDAALEGERFPCYKWIDNTEKGFRLGHVMGLVAGAGVGKTSMALNLFKGFVTANPQYDHLFISLEQTKKEIASRWRTMCGSDISLHKKVRIIDNYQDDGSFRDLSLTELKDYVIKYQSTTNRKVGCVVIDHIGILCNNNKLGQDEGVKQISKAMKGFAIETNTFLIMQSQTSREKAGIGDLELNKDAAFGTSVFENFCDYLITLWQPVKRMYAQGAPTIMAYKFCKIRHKKQGKDIIQEDVPYMVYFDPETELIREVTQDEEKSFNYFLAQATNKRKADRKTELVPYKSAPWKGQEESSNGLKNSR